MTIYALYQWQRQVIFWYKETAFGCALRREVLQLLSQFTTRLPSLQRGGKGAGNLRDLFTCLVDKFETEMAKAGALPFVQMRTRLLRFGPKDSVTAAHIRHDRVGALLF